MNVVILTVGRFVYVKGAEDAVARWSGSGDTVTVVSMRKLDPVDWPITASVELGAARTGSKLGKPGRALARIWPGSVDRQLAAKVRRSTAARAALDAADLVVGVEPGTAQALWWSSRKHDQVPHMLGLEHGLTASQR